VATVARALFLLEGEKNVGAELGKKTISGFSLSNSKFNLTHDQNGNLQRNTLFFQFGGNAGQCSRIDEFVYKTTSSEEEVCFIISDNKRKEYSPTPVRISEFAATASMAILIFSL
jgi:hypothetical protein